MPKPELDPVLIQRVLDLTRRGINVKEACKRVGISRAAAYRYGVRAS